MVKDCGTCKYAIYDSVPYGMGSTSYLSGCELEDKMAREFSEEECDEVLSGDKDCPYWKASI